MVRLEMAPDADSFARGTHMHGNWRTDDARIPAVVCCCTGCPNRYKIGTAGGLILDWHHITGNRDANNMVSFCWSHSNLYIVASSIFSYFPLKQAYYSCNKKIIKKGEKKYAKNSKLQFKKCCVLATQSQLRYNRRTK